MDDSIWAMVFSAGSLRFVQAVSARADAVSATNIFAIRIRVSSIFRWVQGSAAVGRFDLVRVRRSMDLTRGAFLSEGADEPVQTAQIAAHHCIEVRFRSRSGRPPLRPDASARESTRAARG